LGRSWRTPSKAEEASLTPPYALGENTKRGDRDDRGEHQARQTPSKAEMGSEKAGFEGKSSVKSFESRSKNHAYKPTFLQSQADQNLIGNAILGVLLRSEKMWLDKQCPAAILSMPGIAI
jgi:hypothetical protein